jgi:hypothetical protein
MRFFDALDGTRWTVRTQSPGASNIMVVFSHPDGRTARNDRYAWYNIRGPEARDVTGRVDPKQVLDGIGDDRLALLFRRSMLISAADSAFSIPVTHG